MNQDEFFHHHFMLDRAHSTPAAFMAVRAAHYMDIDWRHTETLRILLEGQEGRSLTLQRDEDAIFDSANDAAKAIVGACQSPIEALFVSVLCMLQHSRALRPRINLTLAENWQPEIFRWISYESEETAVTLFQQLKVESYRLDFALRRDGRSVAIELDGHDFHERTKEQAARDKSRDRALAEAGWTVLRFTGSELWKDPVACAAQAMRIAGIQ